MADLRTALLSHLDIVSSAALRHEEQTSSPRSPRALEQPDGISPLRGASTSESQETHVPAQPHMRMKPPSHRQELAKDGLPDTMRLEDLEDSLHFSREFHRLELKMAKKAKRQHTIDRSESYDSKHKRFRPVVPDIGEQDFRQAGARSTRRR